VPALAVLGAVPPLVLLYFLKLKRRQMAVASTLLWRKAVQDLQVNSPFQKLRKNLLLFLQLLVLLCAILAIAEPMWAGDRGVGKLKILLIDSSASMASQEAGGKTRLAIAKEEAHRSIDDLHSADRGMVITFANRARVLCGITDDKRKLHAAVDEITQSDAAGRLTEAMQLAEAPSSEVGERSGTEGDNPFKDPDYLLFSDCRLADAGEVKVQRGRMEVVRIGQSPENSGIVAMDVRRGHEQPENVSVLAVLRNYGAQNVTRDVSLYIDGDLKGVRTVELAPLGPPDKLMHPDKLRDVPEESQASVPFELSLPAAAQIELRLSGEDILPVDDRAFALVSPPRPLTALLVTKGNRFLRQLLRSLNESQQIEHFDTWSPDEYEKAEDEKLIQDGRCKYDVVLLDGHSTNRLPAGNYIFFAAVPLIPDVQAGEKVEGQPLLDWDDTHPILRHVAVQAISVFSWIHLKLPREAVPLIEGPDGPVMALLRKDRNQYLICAFGLFNEDRTYANTNWFLDEGFVVFGYNAVRYLTGGSTAGQIPPVRPGEAFSVGVKAGVRSTTVKRPDGRSDSVPVQGGLATYGLTDRVGIYRIADALPNQEAKAVNLLDDKESFVAPNEDFQVAAGEIRASDKLDRVNRPLWPWLLGALGLLLLIEWFIYNKRVFI
jgi:hypothetical protein